MDGFLEPRVGHVFQHTAKPWRQPRKLPSATTNDRRATQNLRSPRRRGQLRATSGDKGSQGQHTDGTARQPRVCRASASSPPEWWAGRDLNSVDRFPCWFSTPRLSAVCSSAVRALLGSQLTVLRYRPNEFSERDKDAY